MNDQPTTKIKCFIVAMTAFSFSCAAFTLSVLLVVPVIGTILQAMQAPALIQQGAVLLCLFGLPIFAAIRGMDIGARFLDFYY